MSRNAGCEWGLLAVDTGPSAASDGSCPRIPRERRQPALLDNVRLGARLPEEPIQVVVGDTIGEVSGAHAGEVLEVRRRSSLEKDPHHFTFTIADVEEGDSEWGLPEAVLRVDLGTTVDEDPSDVRVLRLGGEVKGRPPRMVG